MKRVRPLEWVLFIFAMLVLAAISWPVFPSGYPRLKTSLCLSNLKQSAFALIMYEEDSDDRYPPRDAWMDASYPYAKTEAIWHCPSVPKGAYGYAFDALLSVAKAPKPPATTPLVYESVNPIRNASDPFTSFLAKGRHERSTNRNLVYADGHARGISSGTVVQ